MPDYNYQQCGNWQRRREVTGLSPLTYGAWQDWLEYGTPTCGARYATLTKKYDTLVSYQAEAASLAGDGPASINALAAAWTSCVSANYGLNLSIPAISCPANSGKCASQCGLWRTKLARQQALPGLIADATNEITKLIGQFQELCDGKPQSCV